MMKTLILFLVPCFYLPAFSQVLPENDLPPEEALTEHVPEDTSVQRRKDRFVLGLGINIIDNTSTRNNQFLNVDQHYNIAPFISIISLERRWKPWWSTEAVFSWNSLNTEKYQNGELIPGKNADYFALDLLGKLILINWPKNTPWLEFHIAGGFGIHTAEQEFNQTLNAGGGIGFWFSSRIGAGLQTLGKWAFKQNQLANNHIMHSAKALYMF